MKQFYADEEELKKDNEKMRKEIIKEQQNTVKSLFHKKIFYVVIIVILLLFLVFVNNWGYLIGMNVNPPRANFKNQLRMYNVSINDQLLPNSVAYHERKDGIPFILTYDTKYNYSFYGENTRIVPITNTYTLDIENYKCYSKKMNNYVVRCYTHDNSSLSIKKQKDDYYYTLRIKYEGKTIYDEKYITDLTPYLQESGTYEITIIASYTDVETTITSIFVIGAPKEEGEDFMNKINIKINDKDYQATLVDNYTSRELLKLLPLSITMQDLNDNEKYYYLDKTLPTAEVHPTEIKKGDIMLYEDNCLVIFYKDFTTHYPYTLLGHIDNAEDLDEIFGSDNINITITQ